MTWGSRCGQEEARGLSGLDSRGEEDLGWEQNRYRRRGRVSAGEAAGWRGWRADSRWLRLAEEEAAGAQRGNECCAGAYTGDRGERVPETV